VIAACWTIPVGVAIGINPRLAHCRSWPVPTTLAVDGGDGIDGGDDQSNGWRPVFLLSEMRFKLEG
jgi:hypothetical protein